MTAPQMHNSTPETSSQDDGLPVLIPLNELQASVSSAYAQVLRMVADLHAGAEPAKAAGLEILLARLRADATWAASEVMRKLEFKIRRQRYISQDVFVRWRAVQSQAKLRLGQLHRDAEGQVLVHEHVFQRKALTHRLTTSVDAAELDAILNGVVSCVVTKAEHLRLESTKALDGWERYRRASPRIGVYDRLEKKWVVRSD